ncbi:MAG TPA: cell division protein ZapA [Gemmatimonadaceae bacterium]|nr:cell division protein ZapA [Gemmatimonadaceae bacterium]
MSTKRSSVKLSIVGEEFAIRTDEPPEHTRAVADHVDRAIRSVQSAGAASDPRKAAILGALEIADELLKERALRTQMAEQLRALTAEIKRMLPPGKR